VLLPPGEKECEHQIGQEKIMKGRIKKRGSTVDYKGGKVYQEESI
jgi:hypothetical protein